MSAVDHNAAYAALNASHAALGARTVAFTYPGGVDCSAALSAAVAAALASGSRTLRLSGDLLFSAPATITITGASDFTIVLAHDLILTKTSPSYFPVLEIVGGTRCHVVGEPGNCIDNQTVESLTFPAAGGNGPFATTWKVANTWDVQLFTTRAGGVLDYQHAGGSTFSVSVNGTTGLATVTKTQVLGDAQSYTVYTPVERLPVVLLTDCINSSVIGVHAKRGSIVSRGLNSRPQNIKIASNFVETGSIRVATVGQEYWAWSSTAYAPAYSDDRSHLGVKVKHNTVIGDLGAGFFGNGLSVSSSLGTGTATARYLKFNERVDGVYVDGWAELVEIDNNDIRYAHGDGIRLFSARAPKIRNNTIIGAGLSGIGPENTTGAPKTKDALCTGNFVQKSVFDGLDFNYGGTVVDTLRTGSPASRGRRFEEFAEYANWTITGNEFSWNGVTDLASTPDSSGQEGGCGIFAWSISSSTITGNVLAYNNLPGVKFDGGQKLIVTNNRAYNNGRTRNATSYYHSGIVLNGVQNSIITNNIFTCEDDPDLFGAQLYGISEMSLSRTDTTGFAKPYTIISLFNVVTPNVFESPVYYTVPAPGQRTFTLPWKLTDASTLSLLYECNAGAAWIASTNYSVNDVVYVSGRVYACTVAGTSASSGSGPTVSSGTQVDGTVTWSFVNTATNTVALTNVTDYAVSGVGTGTVTVTLAADPVMGYALRIRIGTLTNTNVQLTTFGTRTFTKTQLQPGGVQGALVASVPLPWYAGTTSQRNAVPVDAFSYGLPVFDRTLLQPVWYTGSAWNAADGWPADRLRTGTTAQRPTGLNATTDVAFRFYDTTLGKPIWWTGTTWKDAAGSAA